jgi:hypothetical protein
MMDENQRLEFLHREYQEAAKAYARGVQTGLDLFRQYLLGTGVLGALFGAAVGMLKDQFGVGRYVVLIVPTVGIIASVVFILILKQYKRQLNNSRQRCEEIEALFGGKLFSGIAKISNSTRLDTVLAVQIVCGVFIALWTIILFVSLNVSPRH